MPNRSMYDAFPIQLVKELLWRMGRIGMALFVLSPFAIAPTISQLVTVYIVITVWCYYDGCLAQVDRQRPDPSVRNFPLATM